MQGVALSCNSIQNSSLSSVLPGQAFASRCRPRGWMILGQNLCSCYRRDGFLCLNCLQDLQSEVRGLIEDWPQDNPASPERSPPPKSIIRAKEMKETLVCQTDDDPDDLIVLGLGHGSLPSFHTLLTRSTPDETDPWAQSQALTPEPKPETSKYETWAQDPKTKDRNWASP